MTINSPAAGGTQQVYVGSPATPAGANVTFHIWIPSGSKVSSIQPYVQQGAGELDMDRQLAADCQSDGRRMEYPDRHGSRKRGHAPLPTRRSVPDERRLDRHLLRRTRSAGSSFTPSRPSLCCAK